MYSDPIDTHGHTVADAIALYPSDMAWGATKTGTVEADDDKFAITAHGYEAGDPVQLVSKTGGTGLPADGTTMYVLAVADADHFTASATPGGTSYAVTVDASAVAVRGLSDAASQLDGSFAGAGDMYLAQTPDEVEAQLG